MMLLQASEHKKWDHLGIKTTLFSRPVGGLNCEVPLYLHYCCVFSHSNKYQELGALCRIGRHCLQALGLNLLFFSGHWGNFQGDVELSSRQWARVSQTWYTRAICCKVSLFCILWRKELSVCSSSKVQMSEANHQSINQTSITPISPVKPGSVAQQPNRGNSSVTSTGHWAWRYLWGKGQVKEMCLQMFLKGSIWYGWMGRQWEVVP